MLFKAESRLNKTKVRIIQRAIRVHLKSVIVVEIKVRIAACVGTKTVLS
jgi:hypothetical protein